MTAIVDIIRIQETSDGDHEFEVELIEMYIEDAQLHVDSLATALETSDVAELKTVSHTLKGSSANIGATGMQQCALEIEHAASQGDMSLAKNMLERLLATFGETQTYYTEYLSSLE